jgi:hypothetical protein
MGEDEEYGDGIENNPDIDSLINDEGTIAFAVRILWGSLVYDPSITEMTDWTGSLEVEFGVVVVRRLVYFEDGQDYIKPREEPGLVEWVSQTSCHYDGICVNIYIPPLDVFGCTGPDGDAVFCIPTIIFNTEPFTDTFYVEELYNLDTVFQLEGTGNSVAIRSFEIPPKACAKGFLGGRWGYDSTGQGIFYGRWISQNGRLMGHMKGIWGIISGDDASGTVLPVFYGKYVDVNGKFMGLLKGTYYDLPIPFGYGHGYGIYRGPDGMFYGNFYDAEMHELGIMRGYFQLPIPGGDEELGSFYGRWDTHCPIFYICAGGVERKM